MKTVGAFEAKTHLPKLLSRVARGERITITRHGVPVAVLSPVGPSDRGLPADLIEEIKEFRSGRDVSPGEIRAVIDEGREE